MCDAAITEYAEFLRRNRLVPRPAFWSAKNCGGTRFPATLEEANVATLSVPFAPASAFVPAFVVVPDKIKNYGSNQVEVIVPNTQTVNDPLSSVTRAAVPVWGRSYPLRWDFGNGPVTENEAEFTACTGLSWTIGPEHPGYTPQSIECDALMNTHCTVGTEFATRPECSCYRDREHLAEVAPGTSLPVRCLGATCSFGGYLTSEMAEQGCGVTVCQQLILARGSDIVNAGNTEIFCGGRHYNKDDGKPVDAPPDPATTVTPSWWTDQHTYAVLIGAAVLWLAIVLGLALRFSHFFSLP